MACLIFKQVAQYHFCDTEPPNMFSKGLPKAPQRPFQKAECRSEGEGREYNLGEGRGQSITGQ